MRVCVCMCVWFALFAFPVFVAFPVLPHGRRGKVHWKSGIVRALVVMREHGWEHVSILTAVLMSDVHMCGAHAHSVTCVCSTLPQLVTSVCSGCLVLHDHRISLSAVVVESCGIFVLHSAPLSAPPCSSLCSCASLLLCFTARQSGCGFWAG